MKGTPKLPLGILASGSGTNLQAIIDAAEAHRIDATVEVVLSDVPGAFALSRARRHRIPAIAIERRAFPSKQAFEERVVAELSAHNVQLVCLAGFMRLVGPTLLAAFPDRILNIHPALLPAFPGLHAQRQALEYGVKVAGCTVHIVDAETDHGPIIRQAAVEVHEDDTAETLAARILAEEHRIYPEAIQLVAEGRLTLAGRRVAVAPRATTSRGELST
jgi:phosphoribosylglycinamide formyltransferase 1